MASDQTVSLKLEGDASALKKELESSAKSMDDLAGTSDKVGAAIDQVLRGISDSGDAVDQTIRGIDTRLGTLTGADREVFLRANVGQAEAAIREIDRMLTDPSLTDPEIRIALDKRNEASRAIENLKDEMAELGPAAKAAGDDIERGLNLGAIGGAFASAGAADSIDSAVTSSGKLRAQLGLVGDEARAFDAVAKDVYRNNFGESMGHAAQVTGMLHQSLGLVGDDLADTSMLVFSVSDAFEHVGADTQILTDGLRVMKAAWPGIDETRSLDLIAHSFQSGTGNAGDLLDTVQEYGPVFADMGFSADDMFTILNEGMRNGARNTDFLADAFKELGIRIQTEGDTGQQAIAKLFPPDEAERLITDFSRGGEAARDAFQTIAGALVDVKDPQDQYNLSVELFGTKAEDLSTSLVPTLAGSLDSLASSTDDAAGAAESTNEQYDGFRNTLEGLVRSLETSVVGQLGDVGVGFADVASNVGIAVLGLKGMRDMLPGLSGRLGIAATAAGGLAAALPGVFAAMTLQGNINAQGSDALSNFMEQLPDARTADEFAANIDRMIGRYESLQDTANSGGPLFGALQEAYQNVNPNVPNIIADSEAATRAFADAISSAMPQLDAWRENEEEVMRLTGLTAEEVSALASTIGADLSAAGQGGSAAVGLLVDAYEAGVEPTGEFTEVTADATTAQEDLEASIRGVNDALHAQFDPLFAAQDAFLRHKDAQDAVKAAQLEALTAQLELDAAIAEHGRESDEARRAALDFMAAQQRVKDANRDATRSTVDMQAAANRLKIEMREGKIDIELAEAQLRDWVTQGALTEEQAWQMAEELRGTAGAADALGETDPTVYVSMDAEAFWAERARVAQAAFDLTGSVSIGGGRVVRHGGGVIHGPPGQEVDMRALAGEYVIRAPAAQAIGYDQLERLNRADQSPAMLSGGSGVGMSFDYDRLASAVAKAGGVQVIVQRGDQIDEDTVAAIVARKLAV